MTEARHDEVPTYLDNWEEDGLEPAPSVPPQLPPDAAVIDPLDIPF